MKKIIILVSLAFSINAFAQTPNYVPTNGLVGWWPFNGNANDGSGNGNTGTIYGAVLSADRFGSPNSAFNFPINSKIIVPSFSIQKPNLTVSYWTKPFDVNNGRPVTHDWNLGSFSTAIVDGGKFVSSFRTNSGDHNHFNLSDTLSINTWYHLVTVKNKDSSMIYLNGNLRSKSANDSIVSSTADLFFGDNRNGFFSGLVDDIGIWGRALTIQEIKNLYTGGICFQTISVTDTLIINTGITNFNPLTFANRIKIFPNPTNDHITIDNGNISNLTGYKIKITNSLGQQVFQSGITQQQFYVDLSNWTGNGIYFVHIIDGQGSTLDIKKIVLQ